jgi:hypothetical protein
MEALQNRRLCGDSSIFFSIKKVHGINLAIMDQSVIGHGSKKFL